MSDTPTPLADDFAEADHAAWRAKAEKTAPDARFEALIRRTLDGIDVQPLYGPWGEAGHAHPRRAPASEPERPWDLRSRVFGASITEANACALKELEGGAASLLVDFRTVPVRSGDELTGMLDGVLLELAPVALDAGEACIEAAEGLASAARGSPKARLGFHMDPLAVLARGGADLRHEAASTAARLFRAYPHGELFMASGRFVHEAGGTEAQELATALASAVASARSLEAQGQSAGEALGAVTLGVSADNQAFLTLARMRAARMLWGRIAQSCGVDVAARIEARSSRRMLSRQDPWTNLLRLTAAGFGAGAGGADMVTLDPFDLRRGAPSPLALRQARNIQLVLMEEAHLGRVADPAGGSWFVETLTTDLARSAWALFQQIEARGGLAASFDWLAEQVDEARRQREADLREGRAALIGVTLHAHVEETAPAPSSPAPETGRFAPVNLCAPFETGEG